MSLWQTSVASLLPPCHNLESGYFLDTVAVILMSHFQAM